MGGECHFCGWRTQKKNWRMGMKKILIFLPNITENANSSADEKKKKCFRGHLRFFLWHFVENNDYDLFYDKNLWKVT